MDQIKLNGKTYTIKQFAKLMVCRYGESAWNWEERQPLDEPISNYMDATIVAEIEKQHVRVMRFLNIN